MGPDLPIPSSRGGMRTPSVLRTVVVVVMVTVVVFAGLVVAGGQEHNHDYEYSPHLDDLHTETSNTSQGLSSLNQSYEAKYFKCRCDGNQVWDDSRCLDKQTPVAVMHPETRRTVKTWTDSFAGVTVGEVQCSADQKQIHLDPRRSLTQQFTLFQNGSLWWQLREYEHYCIEHTLDALGNISWEAYVCLPPPEVPRCCLENLTPPPEVFPPCSDNPALSFSPPINIGEEFVLWPRVEEKTGSKCKDNEKRLIANLNNGKSHLSFESGEVFVVWKAPNHLQKKQKEGFCVRPEEGGGYAAAICYEDQEATHRALCGNATCVRKCCPEGEIHYRADCIRAENGTRLWKPSFTDTNLSTDVSPPEDLKLLYGLPHCNMYVADPAKKSDDKFYLLENGSLYTPAIPEVDPPTSYCVDNFLRDDNTISTKALICFPEARAEAVCAITKTMLYPAMQLVSSMFLGATLVIYLSVPDLRDKLHGRCLISLAFAFFVAYFLMSASSLSNRTMHPSICTAIGFFQLLSLLAAFFWLNVMCFDIWRTLRKTRTVDTGRRGVHRFLRYSLYSWGCALLIAIVAVVIEQLPPSYNVIRPGFSDSCWLLGWKSMWVYFYVWVSLVVVANLGFFVLVMVILVKGQNNSLLRRSREMNRERMWLYVKLFLVMGITWMAEMLSFKSYQGGNCSPWIFTDIINALQGLILFLVFILNRTTLRKIRTRWKCCCVPHRPIVSPSTTLTSSMSSSFSKRQDSMLSAKLSKSPISARYFNTSASTRNSNAECIVPLKTLQEAHEDPTESP